MMFFPLVFWGFLGKSRWLDIMIGAPFSHVRHVTKMVDNSKILEGLNTHHPAFSTADDTKSPCSANNATVAAT